MQVEPWFSEFEREGEEELVDSSGSWPEDCRFESCPRLIALDAGGALTQSFDKRTPFSFTAWEQRLKASATSLWTLLQNGCFIIGGIIRRGRRWIECSPYEWLGYNAWLPSHCIVARLALSWSCVARSRLVNDGVRHDEQRRRKKDRVSTVEGEGSNGSLQALSSDNVVGDGRLR